uniref:Zn(2)-C6 fungal-type domain-containing protein n=1 Tax=Lotharella oceanica TaxID=641309 RepID=A0A7S2TMM8_9EUKA
MQAPLPRVVPPANILLQNALKNPVVPTATPAAAGTTQPLSLSATQPPQAPTTASAILAIPPIIPPDISASVAGAAASATGAAAAMSADGIKARNHQWFVSRMQKQQEIIEALKAHVQKLETENSNKAEMIKKLHAMVSTQQKKKPAAVKAAKRSAPTKKACTTCVAAKRRCDSQRPCGQCVKRGIEKDCKDSPRVDNKKRKRASGKQPPPPQQQQQPQPQQQQPQQPPQQQPDSTGDKKANGKESSRMRMELATAAALQLSGGDRRKRQRPEPKPKPKVEGQPPAAAPKQQKPAGKGQEDKSFNGSPFESLIHAAKMDETNQANKKSTA